MSMMVIKFNIMLKSYQFIFWCSTMILNYQYKFYYNIIITINIMLYNDYFNLLYMLNLNL